MGLFCEGLSRILRRFLPGMSDLDDFLIIDNDAASRAALREYLSVHEDYKDILRVCSPEEAAQDNTGIRILLLDDDEVEQTQDALCFNKPVRVGALLDTIGRFLRQRCDQSHLQTVSFSGWVLDTIYNTLQRKEGESVRLTEKEKDILILLFEHTGQSVSRDMLLQNVWAYAEGVETHTLETHIYRLRQKIEQDPATPDILLTTETGYRLQV